LLSPFSFDKLEFSLFTPQLPLVLDDKGGQSLKALAILGRWGGNKKRQSNLLTLPFRFE